MDYQGKDNGAVPVREKISYGLASGGGNIITQILGMFLTSYLTDSVGIAAAAVGTMMLVARFFDGASDIIMGGIIDKTKTRWSMASDQRAVYTGVSDSHLQRAGLHE